jgi:hypothetical protein
MWLSRGHKRSLSKNEYGLFSIILKENWDYKGSKYVVDKLINQIYPVSFCDSSLAEFGKVRSWLASNEHHLVTTNSYVLIDRNILIKPSLSIHSSIDFEKPMEKEVVSSIIDEFNSIRNGQNVQNVVEIIETLEEVLIKDSVLLELINNVSNSETVKQEINKKVEQIIANKVAETDNFKEVNKQLENRKSSLERSINKEEEQLKKLKLGFASDIKTTFEKGVVDGRRVLADVALFKAIISPSQECSPDVLSTNKLVASSNDKKYYSINSFKPIKRSAVDDLRALRFKSLEVNRLFETLNDAILIGLTPSFMGNASRILADAFVNSLLTDTVVECCVGPGTTSVPELLDKNNLIDKSKCFVLKNFDISPISLYGHALVDLCYQKFLSGTSDIGPVAVLTFEDSGLGLAYPFALGSSLIIVDTDQIDFHDDVFDLEEYQELIKDTNELDLPSKNVILNLIRSLRVFEGVDDTVRFNRLCGFLKKSYFNRYKI